MTNVENSFRSGVEVNMSLAIGEKLFLNNNATYSYNQITDGGVKSQPLYTPNLIVNQGVSYKPSKHFSVGVSGKYHSESFIDFDNEHVTPSFFVLNANASAMYDDVTFKLQVNNITSEEYFTNGYAVGDTRYFFVNAPMSVYGTIAIKF
jgi:outer membrane receptor protein involved in Fe transport